MGQRKIKNNFLANLLSCVDKQMVKVQIYNNISVQENTDQCENLTNSVEVLPVIVSLSFSRVKGM